MLDAYYGAVNNPVKRPTIKDVAAAAGLSPTTVSQALNRKGVVRKETIERVERIAKDIGYRPNALARGLRSSSLRLIGLTIRPLDSLDTFLPPGVDIYTRFTGAASVTALEHGYSLMLVSDPSKPNSPISALAADAYLVTDPVENDPVLDLLANETLPFIAVGPDPARPDLFHSLNNHARQQTREILTHLEEAGSTKPALVVGTDRNAWNLDTEAEYLQWCEQRNCAPLVLSFPETAGENIGQEAVSELFSGSIESWPDAIYCFTGRHATGIAKAAMARGILVPDDLLIAAGSGTIFNQTGSPSITAFDLRPEERARTAVEAVIRLLEGKLTDQDLVSPKPHLLVRESTTRAHN